MNSLNFNHQTNREDSFFKAGLLVILKLDNDKNAYINMFCVYLYYMLNIM